MAYVFCNQCGHRNPPESSFCSSCGALLDSPRRPHHHAPAKVDPLQDAPGPADDVVVNLADCRPTPASLVVRSGPQAGSAFALTGALTRLGRHPDSEISLDDITVSRRHAEIERSRRRLRRPRRRLAQRHLREPASASTSRRRCTTATSCRSASSASCSSSGRRTGVSVTERALPVDRRGAGAAARGVPRRHHLQDPVPREPGPHRARAHAVGLPEVLRRRRRPARSSCASSARTSCRCGSSATGSRPARRRPTATPTTPTAAAERHGVLEVEPARRRPDRRPRRPRGPAARPPAPTARRAPTADGTDAAGPTTPATRRRTEPHVPAVDAQGPARRAAAPADGRAAVAPGPDERDRGRARRPSRSPTRGAAGRRRRWPPTPS